MSPRAATAALVACLVVSAPGCGPSERESDVAAVVERFHAALERRDGPAACAELSAATAGKLERQVGTPCEEAVLELELPRGAATAHSGVYVTSAMVVLAEGEAAFLDEGAQGWKVSAAGCTQTAPNLPYDCELEG